MIRLQEIVHFQFLQLTSILPIRRKHALHLTTFLLPHHRTVLQTREWKNASRLSLERFRSLRWGRFEKVRRQLSRDRYLYLWREQIRQAVLFSSSVKRRHPKTERRWSGIFICVPNEHISRLFYNNFLGLWKKLRILLIFLRFPISSTFTVRYDFPSMLRFILLLSIIISYRHNSMIISSILAILESYLGNSSASS